MQKTVEREQAALAVVLRGQDKDGVFDRNDNGDGSDHQRNGAKDLVGRGRAGTAEEQLIHRVKRRRADVAVNDAQCSEGQSGKTTTRPVARSRLRHLFGNCSARQISTLS